MLYVLEDFSIRKKLLKHHYDDLLTKHFDVDKINKLLDCKYYWKSIIKDVKKYKNLWHLSESEDKTSFII